MNFTQLLQIYVVLVVVVVIVVVVHNIAACVVASLAVNYATLTDLGINGLMRF